MSDLYKNLMGLSGLDHEPESQTYKRAPFGWPGGKYRSLPHLLPLLPYRGSFVETCGGSGIVGLNRKRSPLEVFNDRFSGVTAFYLCLQDKDRQVELADRLSYFIHSKEMFIWACDTWENCTDLVERAARWFYTIKNSFGSIGRDWGRCTNTKGMMGSKLHEVIPEFPWIHSRIKHWQIDNLDVVDCGKQYENRDSVIYTDPDYLNTARGHYRHEMDLKKHIQILEMIHGGKGFHAVSGYANDVYDDSCWKWTARHTWKSRLTADDQIRDYAEEVLWIKDHET